MGAIGRREYIKRCATMTAAGMGAAIPTESAAEAADDTGRPRIYFGDLHNHNAVGYGLGSPERAFAIAKSHLDFVAVTPHAYSDQSKQVHTMKLWTGYEKITRERWPDILDLNRAYNEPGKFVTIPAYERHSSSVGHYCILFPGDDPPLQYFTELADFQRHAHEHAALLIPHHPGYMEGTAGAVPRYWDSRVTPVLEMFSEHGNAECDTAPGDYIRHSMGPRITSQTMQAFLAAGYRFGVIASTDDHLGFPGAYGEGKTAIIATELTRESIFDALRSRRCYGVSGDKIELDFRLNGQLMGSELPYSEKRNITVSVRGKSRLDRIDILKNNRVIVRNLMPDAQLGTGVWGRPFLVRVEYGWGPMSENQIDLDRIPDVYDWNFDVSVKGAKISAPEPCWQSAPLAEDRRHRISNATEKGFSLESYTSRRRCLFNRDTHQIVFSVVAKPDSRLILSTREPEAKELSVKFSDLLESDVGMRVGRNSIKVHRLIPETTTMASFSFEDESPGSETDCYYARVVQDNGQLAWSSPVWVEAVN